MDIAKNYLVYWYKLIIIDFNYYIYITMGAVITPM